MEEYLLSQLDTPVLYIHTLGGFEKFAEWGLVRPLAQV